MRSDPKVADWSQRIGHLLPEQKDKRWEIEDEAESKVVAAEMEGLVRDLVVPELFKRDSASKLLCCWKSGEYGGLTEVQRRRYVKALEER